MNDSGVIRGIECEMKGCSNRNTEVEKVAGKKLALCNLHGPEWGSHLTLIEKGEMKRWAKEHLRPHAAKRW